MFKPGKVTLNGKKIKVVPSKNKKFPATKGWFIFTYKTWTYYIRKTKLGFQTFKINKKGKVVKGTGGREIIIFKKLLLGAYHLVYLNYFGSKRSRCFAYSIRIFFTSHAQTIYVLIL